MLRKYLGTHTIGSIEPESDACWLIEGAANVQYLVRGAFYGNLSKSTFA